MPREPNETMEEWNTRVANKESYINQQLKKDPNYTPRAELPYQVIVDEIRRNEPQREGESKDKYDRRTRAKARNMYNKGDTSYENNIQTGSKRKRS